MKSSFEFSTRSKLLTGFGALAVLLASAAMLAYIGIATVQATQKSLYEEDFVNALDLAELRAQQGAAQTALLTMLAVAQQSERESIHRAITQRSTETGALLQRLQARIGDDLRLSGKINEFRELHAAFDQTNADQLIPLLAAGKMEEAKMLMLGVQQERHLKMRALANDVGDMVAAHAYGTVTESDAKMQQMTQLIGIAGGSAVLLAIVMALLLNRVVAAPLTAPINWSIRWWDLYTAPWLNSDRGYSRRGDLSASSPPSWRLLAAPFRRLSGMTRRIFAGNPAAIALREDRADERGALVRTFHTMPERHAQEQADLIPSNRHQNIARQPAK